MEKSTTYWEERIPKGTPKQVESAIKAIWQAYPKNCLPKGICDPLYIMNIIAKEFGVGDGKGNFFFPKEESWKEM